MWSTTVKTIINSKPEHFLKNNDNPTKIHLATRVWVEKRLWWFAFQIFLYTKNSLKYLLQLCLKLNKYDVIMYVATTPIPVSTLIEGERADRKLTFLNLNWTHIFCRTKVWLWKWSWMTPPPSFCGSRTSFLEGFGLHDDVQKLTRDLCFPKTHTYLLVTF